MSVAIMMILAVILDLTVSQKARPADFKVLSPATASAEKGPRHLNSEPGGRRVLQRPALKH